MSKRQPPWLNKKLQKNSSTCTPRCLKQVRSAPCGRIELGHVKQVNLSTKRHIKTFKLKKNWAARLLHPNTQVIKFGHTRERNSQTKCAVLLILKEHASLRDEKDESWDINKTVRYLLENFNPKNGKTHVSLFFSNLTVCCICIYRINYTNCECDSWNFLSSCLHDLQLSAWVVLMKHCHCWSTSKNISKYTKKTRRTRFKSEKVSNLNPRRHAMFSDFDVFF